MKIDYEKHNQATHIYIKALMMYIGTYRTTFDVLAVKLTEGYKNNIRYVLAAIVHRGGGTAALKEYPLFDLIDYDSLPTVDTLEETAAVTKALVYIIDLWISDNSFYKSAIETVLADLTRYRYWGYYFIQRKDWDVTSADHHDPEVQITIREEGYSIRTYTNIVTNEPFPTELEDNVGASE